MNIDDMERQVSAPGADPKSQKAPRFYHLSALIHHLFTQHMFL